MKNLIRLVVAAIAAAFFAAPSLGQCTVNVGYGDLANEAGYTKTTDVPSQNNLYQVAQLLKYGDARLVLGPADSLSSAELGQRLQSVLPYCFKPANWVGLWINAGQSGGYFTGVGTAVATESPYGNNYWARSDSTTSGSNGSGSWTARTCLYQPVKCRWTKTSGTTTWFGSTAQIPNQYQEWIWSSETGTPLNDGNVNIWSFSLPYWTSGMIAGGDPFVNGATVRYRSILYGDFGLSPQGVTFVGTRNSGANASANGSTVDLTAGGLAYVDGDIPTIAGAASSVSSISVFMRTVAGVEYASTGIGVVGCRIYRTGVTGLQFMAMASGGSRVDDWINSRFYSNADIARYLSYAIGETPGVAGPKNGPNVFMICLGTNLTAGATDEFGDVETNDQSLLAAGNYTSYKARQLTLINRIRAICDINGVSERYVILVSPYRAGQPKTIMDGLSRAAYELSQEHPDVAFINGYALLPNEINANSGSYGNFGPMQVGTKDSGSDTRFLADNTGPTYTDEVHTTFAGSVLFMSNIWNQIEAALASPSNRNVSQ